MVKALGAETMDEAIAIIKTAGIQKEDIDELMMDQVMAEIQRE